MTESEKTELLATGLMWWRRDSGYWIDEAGDVGAVHVVRSPVEGWQPFAHIEHAKQVQEAMIKRGWSTGTDARPGAKWFGYFEKRDSPEKAGIFAAESEARAICEAAGRALGLWE